MLGGIAVKKRWSTRLWTTRREKEEVEKVWGWLLLSTVRIRFELIIVIPLAGKGYIRCISVQL
jgi:hypothetical protein